MSIFTRLKDLFRANKTARKHFEEANPFENTDVGDVVELEFEEYVVTGKVKYHDLNRPPHRFVYYLRSGKKLACLIVEKGRVYDCLFLQFVEGSLDDPNDVPSEIDLDDASYKLEYYRTDQVITKGQTDFLNENNVMYWRYIGSDDKYFILQWQEGKYVALEGVRVLDNSIKFLRAS